METKGNEVDIDTAYMIEIFHRELEELKKQKLHQEQEDLIVMHLGDKMIQSKYESLESNSNSDSLLNSADQDSPNKNIQLPENFESFQEEPINAKGYQTPSPKAIKKQIFDDYKESYKVFELNSSPPDPALGTNSTLESDKKKECDEESIFFITNKDTGEVFDIRKQDTVISLYENKGKKISIPNQTQKRAWQDFWKERKQELFDLWDACEIGDMEKLDKILDKSQTTLPLNINTKGLDDFTALHLAALEGHPKVVKKLIDNEANVESVSSMGRKPLHIACLRGNLEVVKILVESKADVNAQDRDFNTPLHLAVEYGCNDILTYLLERKADLNIKNYQGMTPRDMCTSLATIKIFDEKGSNQDGEDTGSHYGRTLFGDRVLHNARKDHVEKLLHLTNKTHKEQKIIEKIEKQESQENKDTTPRKDTGQKLDKKQDTTPVKKDSAELERKNTGGKKDDDKKVVKKEELSAFKSKISRIFIFDYLTNSKERNSNPDPAEEKIGPQSFNYIKMLGKGSFGEVYLAEKKTNKKLYAIKVLEKDRIFNQNLVRYAKTERNVLSIMNHPFIVKLNFAFQTDKKLFLVMDFCAGGDMGKMLQKKRKVPEDVARIYIAELLLALETLHKNLIIFRDLKPDNVVLDEEGHALLTDFGLSKQGIENNLSKSFCGSVAYLAPEMLNRMGHGRTVDWYLLGVLLYELLVGIPPYYHSNRDQLFENIKKGPLMLPRSISENAKDLIKNLLIRDPQKRMGSKRDAEEIKAHPWFEGVNWKDVYDRKMRPPPIPQKDSNFMNDYITVAFEKDSKGKKELQIKDWSFICRDGEDVPDKI